MRVNNLTRKWVAVVPYLEGWDGSAYGDWVMIKANTQTLSGQQLEWVNAEYGIGGINDYRQMHVAKQFDPMEAFDSQLGVGDIPWHWEVTAMYVWDYDTERFYWTEATMDYLYSQRGLKHINYLITSFEIVDEETEDKMAELLELPNPNDVGDYEQAVLNLNMLTPLVLDKLL